MSSYFVAHKNAIQKASSHAELVACPTCCHKNFGCPVFWMLRRALYIVVAVLPFQKEKKNQILFSFSTDKDRRTDSRIRRKNTAQPAAVSSSIFVGAEREENLIGMIPTRASLRKKKSFFGLSSPSFLHLLVSDSPLNLPPFFSLFFAFPTSLSPPFSKKKKKNPDPLKKKERKKDSENRTAPSRGIFAKCVHGKAVHSAASYWTVREIPRSRYSHATT